MQLLFKKMITFLLVWIGSVLGVMYMNYVLHKNNPKCEEPIIMEKKDV